MGGYKATSISKPDKGEFINSLFENYSYRNLKQEEQEKNFIYKKDGKNLEGKDYWSMHSQFFYDGKNTTNSLYKDATSGQASTESQIFKAVDSDGNPLDNGVKIINDLPKGSNNITSITEPGYYILREDFKGALFVEPALDSEGTFVFDLNGFRFINTTTSPYAIRFYNKGTYSGNKTPYIYLINSYDYTKYSQEQREYHTSTFIYKSDTISGRADSKYIFLEPGQDIPTGYKRVDESDDDPTNDYYSPNTYFTVEGGVITGLNNNYSGVSFVTSVANASRQEEMFTFSGLNIAGNDMVDLTGQANYGAGGIYIGSVQDGGGQYKTYEDSKNLNSYGNIVNCNVVGNRGSDGGSQSGITAGGIHSASFYNLVNSIVDANKSSIGGGLVLYKYAHIYNTDISYNWADENQFPSKYDNYAGYGGGVAVTNYYVNFLGNTYNSSINSDGYYEPVLYDTIFDSVNITNNLARIGGGIFWADYGAPNVTNEGYYLNTKLFTLKDTNISNNTSLTASGIFLSDVLSPGINDNLSWSNNLKIQDSNFKNDRFLTFLGDNYITNNVSDETLFIENKTSDKYYSKYKPAGMSPESSFVSNLDYLTLDFKGNLTLSDNKIKYKTQDQLVTDENDIVNLRATFYGHFNSTDSVDLTKDYEHRFIKLNGDISGSKFGLAVNVYQNTTHSPKIYQLTRDTTKETVLQLLNKNIFAPTTRGYYLHYKNDNIYFCEVGHILYSDPLDTSLSYDGLNHEALKPTNPILQNRYNGSDKLDASSANYTYQYYLLKEEQFNDIENIKEQIRIGKYEGQPVSDLSFIESGTYKYIVKFSASKDDPFFSSQNVTGLQNGLDWTYYEPESSYFGLVEGTTIIKANELSSSDFSYTKEFTYTGEKNDPNISFAQSATLPDSQKQIFFDDKAKLRYMTLKDGKYQYIDEDLIDVTTGQTIYYVVELLDTHNYVVNSADQIVDAPIGVNLGEFKINPIELNESDFTSANKFSYNSNYQKPVLSLSDTTKVIDKEKDSFLSNLAEYYVANKEGNTYIILNDGAKDASVLGYDYKLLLKLNSKNYVLGQNKTSIDGEDYLIVSSFTIDQVKLTKEDFTYDTTLEYSASEQKGNVRLNASTNVQENDKAHIFESLGAINYALFDGTNYTLMNNPPKDITLDTRHYFVLFNLASKTNYLYDNPLQIDGLNYLNLGELTITKKSLHNSDFNTIGSTIYNGQAQSPDVYLSANTSIPQSEKDNFLNNLATIKYASLKDNKWTIVSPNSFIQSTNENNKYYVLVKLDANSNYVYGDETTNVDIDGITYMILGEYVINKITFESKQEWLEDMTFKPEDTNKEPSLNTTLPEGIRVEFVVKDQEGNIVKVIDKEGTYTVTANFIYDKDNYNEIKSLSAKYVVKDSKLSNDFIPWILAIIAFIVFITLLILFIVLVEKKKKQDRFIKYKL